VVFFLIAWLSGCATTSSYKSHTFSQEKFQADKKSVLLLKGYRSYKTLAGDSRQGPLSLVIKHCELPAVEYELKNANNYSVMMVEPGTYVIEKITWDNGVQVKSSIDPGLLADNMISYGAFNVAPGEVAYLGTLKIKDEVNKFYINHENELDSAQEYLQSSKYSNLNTIALKYKSMQVSGEPLNS
jgi:hypothetical protein